MAEQTAEELLASALAQLRHLYVQMMQYDHQPWVASITDGLLAPQIRKLEKLQDLVREDAAGVSTAPSGWQPLNYKLGDRCPRCDSPAPHLHPAMQFEGEVQPCSHPFHEIRTNQNPPAAPSGPSPEASK